MSKKKHKKSFVIFKKTPHLQIAVSELHRFNLPHSQDNVYSLLFVIYYNGTCAADAH